MVAGNWWEARLAVGSVGIVLEEVGEFRGFEAEGFAMETASFAVGDPSRLQLHACHFKRAYYGILAKPAFESDYGDLRVNNYLLYSSTEIANERPTLACTFDSRHLFYREYFGSLQCICCFALDCNLLHK